MNIAFISDGLGFGGKERQLTEFVKFLSKTKHKVFVYYFNEKEGFLPIINPPQVGILGIGAIREKCAAIDGKVEVRPVMKVTLSADHRAVDGAVGAQFLKKLTSILESAA